MTRTVFRDLAELYSHSIASYRDNKSFSIYNGENLTYSQFAQQVEYISDILKDKGLAAGDKVALLGSNMPNWCAGYFAAVVNGMVIVPVLPDFSSAEVNMIITHSEAKAVIVSDKQLPKISGETLSSLNAVIRMADLAVIRSKDGNPRIYKKPEIEPDTIAAIIYTSGTTSTPKGVMLSHGNLCAQLDMVYDVQTVNQSDVFLSILPLSHTYECSLGMLLPFMCGASVVYITKPPTTNVLLPVLRNVRPTIILSVPLIMEKIFKSQVLPKLTDTRLKRAVYSLQPGRRILHLAAGKALRKTFGGRVRFFGIGGSKVEPRVERFLSEGKFPYAIGYGLTETAPLLAGVDPSTTRLESTGPAVKGIELRIDNANPATGEGEIVARGANIMKGYFKNPEATQKAFTKDGWLRTKDLGVFDKDGFLYIKGRLDNMIIGASGENIYPEEIEHVINQNALVVDSIVKEEKGKLVALVQFNREELAKRYNLMKEELGATIEALKEEILNYVNARVNHFSQLSLVVDMGHGFEKTPTHKIKRFLYT